MLNGWAKLGKALVKKRHSVRKRSKRFNEKIPLIPLKEANLSYLLLIGSPITSGKSIIVFPLHL